MKIMEIFSKKLPREDKLIMRAFSLRPGMWVKCGGRVGILTDLEVIPTNPDPHGRVVFTDSDKGENLDAQIVPLSGVTQASYKQIPTKRRPNPNTGAALGYI